MADCTETLRELYEYLDGELTDAKRTHIEQHLNDCSPCYEVFDFEAELRMVVRKRCTETVPDHLRSRIARAIDEADTNPTRGATGGSL